MLNIKNNYAIMYEEELEKYKMEQPEYFSEDDDGDLEDLFSGSINVSSGDVSE